MAINVDAIVRVIAQDATLRWSYFDEHGNTCVVGGLVMACGEGRTDLEAVQRAARYLVSESGLPDESRASAARLRAILLKHYGLKRAQVDTLQRINDDFRCVVNRRRALIAQVRAWGA